MLSQEADKVRFRIREVLGLFVLLIVIGIGFTLLSAMLVSDFQRFHPFYMLPCIRQVFNVPESVRSHGFPVFWLFRVDGVRMIGCGPIVGAFSHYSFCFIGFLLNMILYALIFSPIILLKYLVMRTRLTRIQSSPTINSD
jgi:hypothetical protein